MESNSEQPQKPSRGRPRAFDADAALEKAMHVFWKHGYEGTSLDDLTDAMGINRPSLYAAFGNKEALFRKAIDRYSDSACGKMQTALAAPTAREVVQQLLAGAVPGPSCKTPTGCMLVQGALVCSADAEAIRVDLIQRRAATEKLMRHRFERAIKAGDLPSTANAAALARFVSTVMHGLSIQASGGATREQMLAVVDVALQAFPATPKRPKASSPRRK